MTVEETEVTAKLEASEEETPTEEGEEGEEGEEESAEGTPSE